MSGRSSNASAKKRSFETSDNNASHRKQINVFRCDADSKSSSNCSKKSHKKILKDNKHSESFFTVEKITGFKLVQGRSFYRVRWQGYDESEDSWEPEDNLENVMDLIEEFMSTKSCSNEGDDGVKASTCPRSRTTGGFEYVPSNKVIAHKTKFFDDIRDGKIDLTKNDLYSRVKTRKRLQSETVDEEKVDAVAEDVDLTIEDSCTGVMEVSAIASCDKIKYYQSNLFEMTAEFMKNNNFDKCLTTVASKSASTNDDISSFNCSISPNTNQSDDLMLQSSPLLGNFILDLPRKSVATQTELLLVIEEISEAPASESTVEAEPQDMPSPVSEAPLKVGPPQRLVTSEDHLMSIYIDEVRSGGEALSLPSLQTESELVRVGSLEELRSAIVLNRYSLVRSTLEGPAGAWLDQEAAEGALLLAAARDQANMLRLLLRHGCPVDGDGESALMAAARLGHVHAVRTLLEHGARVDRRDYEGQTSLGLALTYGRAEAALVLLEHGADLAAVAGPPERRRSAAGLVADLVGARRLSVAAGADLLSGLHAHQRAADGAVEAVVGRLLAQRGLRRGTALLPVRSVGVIEGGLEVLFEVGEDGPEAGVPLLLLPHILPGGRAPLCWLDRDRCLVAAVLLNGHPQAPLAPAPFVTSLWPLVAGTNRLCVHFTAAGQLEASERRVRVALVGLVAFRDGPLVPD